VLATPATKQKRKRLEEKLAKGGALLIREGEL
jgi:hypothetical protein